MNEDLREKRIQCLSNNGWTLNITIWAKKEPEVCVSDNPEVFVYCFFLSICHLLYFFISSTRQIQTRWSICHFTNTLWLGPPSPLAASSTVALLLDLYSPQFRTGFVCVLRSAPLRFGGGADRIQFWSMCVDYFFCSSCWERLLNYNVL